MRVYCCNALLMWLFFDVCGSYIGWWTFNGNLFDCFAWFRSTLPASSRVWCFESIHGPQSQELGILGKNSRPLLCTLTSFWTAGLHHIVFRNVFFIFKDCPVNVVNDYWLYTMIIGGGELVCPCIVPSHLFILGPVLVLVNFFGFCTNMKSWSSSSSWLPS